MIRKIGIQNRELKRFISFYTKIKIPVIVNCTPKYFPFHLSILSQSWVTSFTTSFNNSDMLSKVTHFTLLPWMAIQIVQPIVKHFVALDQYCVSATDRFYWGRYMIPDKQNITKWRCDKFILANHKFHCKATKGTNAQGKVYLRVFLLRYLNDAPEWLLWLINMLVFYFASTFLVLNREFYHPIHCIFICGRISQTKAYPKTSGSQLRIIIRSSLNKGVSLPLFYSLSHTYCYYTYHECLVSINFHQLPPINTKAHNTTILLVLSILTIKFSIASAPFWNTVRFGAFKMVQRT